MTKPAANTNERKPEWNQKALGKFRRARDKATKADDAAKLSRLFNLAAKSPELKDALDWAKAHGIKFIVDRKSSSVGGYYWVGSGVVAFGASSAFSSDDRLAGVAVHEIRHAWQDWQGMIPSVESKFSDYNIKIALIEADATTHQKLAERQVKAAQEREWAEGLEKRNPALGEQALERAEQSAKFEAERREARLRDGFMAWYNGPLPGIYGTTAYRLFGSKLGIPGVRPRDHGIAFKPEAVPAEDGIDLTRPEQLRRLGRSFNGSNRNYIDLLDKNELFARLLSRQASAAFFPKYGPRAMKADRKVIEEIRKRELLLKFARGKPVTIAL